MLKVLFNVGAGNGTVLPVYQRILRATNKTQHVWSFKGSEKCTVHIVRSCGTYTGFSTIRKHRTNKSLSCLSGDMGSSGAQMSKPASLGSS